VVLGSTGSIGRQALEVIAAEPDLFELVGLCAGSDRLALSAQVEATGATEHGLGGEEAERLAQLPQADIVLNAVVGAAGLRASIAALEAGKRLALANKESLVAGGEICLEAARRGGGTLIPVDSEHAALAQCLSGIAPDSVERVILTASGGPFRTRADLTSVTVEEALAHPTWSMGPKITIDSATLMNKGLEVIEAHFFFGTSFDDIGVLVHPQSIVHAIAELTDGSMVMQAAPTDMKIPIKAALTYPDRKPPAPARLPLAATAPLEFEEVDRARFPALDLAYAAGRAGGTAPATLNAANEVAVASFLEGSIPFTDIPVVVEQVLEGHAVQDASSLEAVLSADGAARRTARDRIAERQAIAETVRI
jgi:1-deoxy-D-xylulose-5-phosphate reductoisomerase